MIVKMLMLLLVLSVQDSKEKGTLEDPKTKQEEKKEPVKFVLPLGEPLKEEQVKKLEEALKKFDCAEIKEIKVDSKELEVLVKSVTQLSELEGLAKKADVKINKDDLILKGKITLLLRTTYENQP